MPTEKTLSATLYLVHVPDVYTDEERQRGASWPLGAGHYEWGVEVDGARIPLGAVKAGKVDDAIARAQDARRTAEAQQAASATASQATQAQPEQPATVSSSSSASPDATASSAAAQPEQPASPAPPEQPTPSEQPQTPTQ